MATILNVFLLALAIFIVANFMPSIKIKTFWTAVIVAVVYSIINFFIGWLLIFLSLPFIFITFGLFKFVINAFLLWITDQLIDDFKIEGFTSTLIAALLITITDSALKWLIRF